MVKGQKKVLGLQSLSGTAFKVFKFSISKCKETPEPDIRVLNRAGVVGRQVDVVVCRVVTFNAELVHRCSVCVGQLVVRIEYQYQLDMNKNMSKGDCNPMYIDISSHLRGGL
jgi:hypothetical protein